VVARITSYQTPPDALQPLLDEIEALARARSGRPVGRPLRRAEFFFVNTSRGDGLSLVIGDDPTVTAAIELDRSPSNDPEELDVLRLQVGGPRDSGTVEALFGRIVRCGRSAVGDVSFNGDAVPASPDVWTRMILLALDGQVLAVAVGPDRAAIDDSLEKFSLRASQVDDYDEVAYHFLLR
jgi:hypothetical protein